MSVTHDQDEPTRRDFLYIGTGAFAAVGAVHLAWPFIDQMNPAADVLALATINVDLTPIPVGQQIKLLWQGKPVFVRHRSEEEIKAAEEVEVTSLPDPEPDAERIKTFDDQPQRQWLVMIGVCTHLGCVPLGEQGEYDGWFCPCHGSHYDTSGRIRKGPAPRNLEIPPYEFVSNTEIKIG